MNEVSSEWVEDEISFRACSLAMDISLSWKVLRILFEKVQG